MGSASSHTTASLLTAGGSGGIAVIALRGPDTRRILREVFTPYHHAGGIDPSDDRLWLGAIRADGETLDEAIVTLRADPAAEYIAEVNIHGGPRVCQRVLQLLKREGAAIVPAVNVDASLWPLAAEGLDNPAIGRELLEHLPSAPTAAVVTLLTRQWSAGLSRLARDAIATIEQGSADATLADTLLAAADGLATVRRLLDPPEVVIAGPPNAGKSTLANALLGREACIVTDVPGTTRDWVREIADLGGPAVWLTDTAGLWAPDDPVDHESVQRAWQRIDRADLVVAVYDVSAPPDAADTHWRRLIGEPHILQVANKIDRPAPPPEGAIPVAAASGRGLDELRAAVLARLGLDAVAADSPTAFTERQAALLHHAAADLATGGSGRSAVAALTDLLSGR